MACTFIVLVDLSGQVTLQQRWARTGRCLKMTDGVHVLYQWSCRQGGTTALIGSRRPGCAAAATSAITSLLDQSESVHACCRFWLEEDVITFAAITLLKLDWEWYRFLKGYMPWAGRVLVLVALFHSLILGA
jgi:hypothetical protein